MSLARSEGEQRLQTYLLHIVEACGRIKRYVIDADLTIFLADELMQDAVIRNLEVIGEASRNIMTRHPEFCAQEPALPLAAAYQMRNALAHGYFQIDFELVWKTVVSDIPGLESAIQTILSRNSPPSP